MSLRKLLPAGALALALVFGSTAAHADSGWARYRDHYVRWKTPAAKPPANASPRALAFYLRLRDRAILRSKRANDRYRDWLASRAPVATATASGIGGWYAVAVCETGLHPLNGTFVGYLGIRRENWIAYGGPPLPPRGAPWPYSLSTDVSVAVRIQPYPPDESGGCVGW